MKPILELARTFFEPHLKSDYADTEVIPPFAQRLTGFVSRPPAGHQSIIPTNTNQPDANGWG